MPSATRTCSALLLHAPTGADANCTAALRWAQRGSLCRSGLDACVRTLALVNLTLLYFSSAGATTMLRRSLPITSRLSRLPTSASAACEVVAGGGAYLVGTYLHARDFALLLCVRASKRKRKLCEVCAARSHRGGGRSPRVPHP